MKQIDQDTYPTCAMTCIARLVLLLLEAGKGGKMQAVSKMTTYRNGWKGLGTEYCTAKTPSSGRFAQGGGARNSLSDERLMRDGEEQPLEDV